MLAYNDLMAIGLIRGLRQRSCRVSQDCSVVGFDNIIASDLVTPALTTVATPLVTSGEAAVRHITATIAGTVRRRGGEPMVMPARLVVRESTAPPPQGGARPGRGSGEGRQASLDPSTYPLAR